MDSASIMQLREQLRGVELQQGSSSGSERTPAAPAGEESEWAAQPAGGGDDNFKVRVFGCAID